MQEILSALEMVIGGYGWGKLDWLDRYQRETEHPVCHGQRAMLEAANVRARAVAAFYDVASKKTGNTGSGKPGKADLQRCSSSLSALQSYLAQQPGALPQSAQ